MWPKYRLNLDLKSTGAVVIGSTIGLNVEFPKTTFAQSKSILKVALIGCGGRDTGAASQAIKAFSGFFIHKLYTPGKPF